MNWENDSLNFEFCTTLVSEKQLYIYIVTNFQDNDEKSF